MPSNIDQSTELRELCTPVLVSKGITELQLDHVIGEIGVRYNEPWRHYHNPDHVTAVTRFLVEQSTHLEDAEAMVWAALFHDVIYMPQAPSGVNEELSAQLAETRLTELGMAKERLLKVGSAIRATATHESDNDPDTALFLDGDLAILGSDWDSFCRYDDCIREEYSFAPEEVYREGRRQILESFLRRDNLFVTNIGHRLFEETARANLERKLNNMPITG